jgi:hypothetical protein
LKLINKALLIVKVIINVTVSVMKIVIGIYEINFHTIHGKNIIGKAAIRVVIVQLIKGDLNSSSDNKTESI